MKELPYAHKLIRLYCPPLRGRRGHVPALQGLVHCAAVRTDEALRMRHTTAGNTRTGLAMTSGGAFPLSGDFHFTFLYSEHKNDHHLSMVAFMKVRPVLIRNAHPTDLSCKDPKECAFFHYSSAKKKPEHLRADLDFCSVGKMNAFFQNPLTNINALHII